MWVCGWVANVVVKQEIVCGRYAVYEDSERCGGVAVV
jgi:hypothetical protein